jgi:hypothetical protein
MPSRSAESRHHLSCAVRVNSPVSVAQSDGWQRAADALGPGEHDRSRGFRPTEAKRSPKARNRLKAALRSISGVDRVARPNTGGIWTTGANSPCTGLRRRFFATVLICGQLREVRRPACRLQRRSRAAGRRSISLGKMSRVPSRSLTVGLSDRQRLAAVTRLRGQKLATLTLHNVPQVRNWPKARRRHSADTEASRGNAEGAPQANRRRLSTKFSASGR